MAQLFYLNAMTRLEAECESNHELLELKFRIKLQSKNRLVLQHGFK